MNSRTAWAFISVLSLFSILFACGDSTSDPTPVPPEPSVLTAVPAGNFVQLSWTICTDADFSNYVVYRSFIPAIEQNPSSATALAVNDDPNDIEYLDSPPIADTTYYYAIRTTDDESLFSWSNESSVVFEGGGGGSLQDVTGFQVNEASSGGCDVALEWNPVFNAYNGVGNIDGYKLYIREDVGSGTWTEIAIIPASTTTYTHAAEFAGEYGIIAYDGVNTSENYVTCNDMPNLISSSYTIWNNHAPAASHNGFIFGATSGQTCLAGQGGHDMYCYDGGSGNLTWLYAGDYGTFGGGNDTNFYEHASGFGMPGSGPWSPPAGPMVVGDVIFAELFDAYWVKIYVTALPHYEGGTDNAYGITFYYDIQPMQGLKLFTTDSTP